VRIPPPFFFLIPILGGLALHRSWPWPVPGSPVLDAIAGVLVVAWLLLMMPSLILFFTAGTSPLPFRPANRLVISGAYRFTRNPMYLGFALLTLASGPLFDSWWPVALLPIALVLVQRFVIAREERYLRRRFGAEYESYCRRVRRWL
jgi:protein-S-isoprenylcysteine O-methyltransferase Ste14